MNDIFQAVVEEILTTKYREQIEKAVDVAVSNLDQDRMQELVVNYLEGLVENWFENQRYDQPDFMDGKIGEIVKSVMDTEEVKEKIKELAIEDLESESSQDWLSDQIADHLYDSSEWTTVLDSIAKRLKFE